VGKMDVTTGVKLSDYLEKSQLIRGIGLKGHGQTARTEQKTISLVSLQRKRLN